MANEFKYCLVQVFAWQVDKRKQKQFLRCEECPFREKCKKQKTAPDPVSWNGFLIVIKSKGIATTSLKAL
jgi:hypothetical protein